MAWHAEPTLTAGVVYEIAGLRFRFWGRILGSPDVLLEDVYGQVKAMDREIFAHAYPLLASDAAEFFEEQQRCHKRKRRVQSVLEAWTAVLPPRILNEDFGDWVEDLNRRLARGQKWLVWLRVCACVFWTVVNSIGYIAGKARRDRRAI
ncbi:hypothetical protein HY634_04375 [Candidatus Uhrbacteria bacterium]|nr:hypothetical protein [Candidatus Uhrbacteria bacterium]